MSEALLREALDAADREIERRSAEVSRGQWRLRYHLMPPVGWMNDPNGFIHYRDAYHLFFQFWPFAPEWGPMHWGHAVSQDLVHWQMLPTALAPSEEYDRGEGVTGYGCFSGSATVDDQGRLVLMYTGHVDGRDPMQTQNVAFSEDGIRFVKSPVNPVIAAPPTEGGNDFRDPKIFDVDGQTFAIIGTSKDRVGKGLLYRAGPQLTEWDYVGVAAESAGHEGTMWECPDLFAIGDRFALIVSPMEDAVNSVPIVQLGRFDAEQGRFHAETTQVLDAGVDFYAPQTMITPSGRRIMIGWMQQWFQRNVTAAEGWSGAMTIPRELVLREDRLLQQPVAELEALRGETLIDRAIRVDPEGFSIDTGCSAEVRVVLPADQAHRVRIGVRASADRSEQTLYLVDTGAGRVSCDRSLSGEGDVTGSVVEFEVPEGSLELRFFLDVCSVELFIDEGAAVLTNRIYPAENSTRFYIESVDDQVIDVQEFTVWPLGAVG